MRIALLLMGIIVFLLLCLLAWRSADRRADNRMWGRLAAHQPSSPGVFEPALIDGLPEPARRFFEFSIEPGAPLYTVAVVSMEGELSLGNKEAPNYMPMTAEEILAAPNGFVWKLIAGNGFTSVTGSDAAEDGISWSRFWLLGTVPVARAGKHPDHSLSAFGRYIAEALIWTPAALLPADNVRWESVSESTARVTVAHMGLEQAVDLTVDAHGRPTMIVFERWSDANPEKTFQHQPFGGYLSEFREFGGYQLPTRVEAGNFFATEDYFPFFRVTVTAVHYPDSREG